MLDKTRGYYEKRPFYAVDGNAAIVAGMVAFLGSVAGVTVATVAASGDTPIGTFWKDAATTNVRGAIESGTFNAGGTINLQKGNVSSTAFIKVTNAAGTVTYTQGVDYSVATANGVVTRIGGGAILALATVVISYRYNLVVGQDHWDNASTRWSQGVNYDRQPNDTIGSGKVTVVEGDAIIYTDQYDPTQTYTLNAVLRADANSLWSTVGAGTGISSVCGRVIEVPSASDPFLGVAQIRVTA